MNRFCVSRVAACSRQLSVPSSVSTASLPRSVLSQSSMTHRFQRRQFLSSITSKFRNKGPKVVVDETLYDKQQVHYTGKILGVSTDKIVYYLKINGGFFIVFLGFYFFIKGYMWLTEFSMASVARFGFLSGLATGVISVGIATMLRRKTQINPNAVYNQSLALVMRHPTVQELLGPHPRTGDFKAYCATGGFKLPLLRRIRSGSYELADLLGTKPRRLQMMYMLKNPANGREGLVTIDVHKDSVGVLSSVNTFRSLAVIITDSAAIGADDPKTIVLIGTEADMFMRNFTKLH